MPKGKAIKPVLKNPQVQKLIAGAGASIVDEILDNRYINAAEGALVGSAVAGPIGAVGGGLAGWFLADEGTVMPVDMICIPAYEAYMIQGTPAFTIYARAGETIVPTGGNVADVQQVMATNEIQKPKRTAKKTGWHRYIKQKKNQIKFKSGKMKGRLNLKAMGRAYRKSKKGGKK
ncbi:unnamed protein product [marine sediment metagenome]|uniref:Uncharacterized protein n=1 Tax=marine sediment metagenome TaxID=412755 RepID=X1B1I1_9ZZZZ